MGRLTHADTRLGGYAYRYDAVGNRTEKRHTDQSGTTQTETYTYPPEGQGNRLLAIEKARAAQPQATKAPATESLSYNPSGSPLKAGALVYEYDSHQRPIRVYRDRDGHQTLIAEYTYNRFGERIKKVVYSHTKKPKVTYYLYDGHHLTAEADETGRITAQYLYYKNRPIIKLEGDTVYALHTDHLGTPRAATDEDGNIVWAADYSPFGKAHITTAEITLNLRFPGQYADQETGRYYNYLRTYDPGTGRYTTADPIGLAGGINAYAYVGNDPLGLTDVLGLAPGNDILNYPGGNWGLNGPIIEHPQATSPGVNTRTFTEKLQVVFNAAANAMPGAVGNEIVNILKGLATPEGAAGVAVVLGVWWTATNATGPVGWFANALLAGGAYFMYGKSVFDLVGALYHLIPAVNNATCDADLERAGRQLADDLVQFILDLAGARGLQELRGARGQAAGQRTSEILDRLIRTNKTDADAAGVGGQSGRNLTPPAESAVDPIILKRTRALARNATKNPDSRTVVLGSGYTGDGSIAYTEFAEARGATYLKFDNWDEMVANMSPDEIWEINKAFLDEQIAQGKRILFSHDPNNPYPRSFFKREVDYLQEELGYTFEKNAEGIWEATKK